ncbi:MAG: hypothetical protein ACLTVY_00080, partial [Faecalibacterium sp.]
KEKGVTEVTPNLPVSGAFANTVLWELCYGERPIVHIAIVCGLWQGASYSGTHPVFILSLHRLFEIPPSASRIRIVSRF